MFTLLAIFFFTIKLLAISVVGLFFIEDLELTKSVGGVIYNVYLVTGIITFVALLFFGLSKSFMWLIIFCVSGFCYIQLYNFAPSISEIHQSNDLKSRYFSDTTTFVTRMSEVFNTFTSKIQQLD